MNKAKIYLQAIRPFSLTVSFFPPLLAAALFLSRHESNRLQPGSVLLCLAGAMLAHIAANLISDYFDFKNGIDRKETFGSSGVLTGGLLQPRNVLFAGLLTLFSAATIAFYLILISSQPLLLSALILSGAILAVFYTAGPFPFKYKALGDIAVFLAFGPLMSAGSFLVYSQQLKAEAFLLTIPPAFLVTAILHANNFRDMSNDAQCGIKTIALKLGTQNSVRYYRFLLFSSFITLIVLVPVLKLHFLLLLALAAVPEALRLSRLINKACQQNNFEIIIPLDALSARLHLQFCLLMLIGLGFSYFLK